MSDSNVPVLSFNLDNNINLSVPISDATASMTFSDINSGRFPKGPQTDFGIGWWMYVNAH